jgi:hypothetical protein
MFSAVPEVPEVPEDPEDPEDPEVQSVYCVSLYHGKQNARDPGSDCQPPVVPAVPAVPVQCPMRAAASRRVGNKNTKTKTKRKRNRFFVPRREAAARVGHWPLTCSSGSSAVDLGPGIPAKDRLRSQDPRQWAA